ncbi:MAG: hypothetical protein GX316_08925, partial [Firmicutes bacterium]|nr:hypothetical protein [Bacillota bacterium]
MAEKSFPFNSELVDDMPDRQYYAEDFARYFEQFIGNGVYPNPANGLKVVSNDSNVVTVNAGAAFINGYGYELDEDMDIEIDLADPNYNRKDSIVVRLDLENREVNTLYLPG